jgi:hypothetical protein
MLLFPVKANEWEVFVKGVFIACSRSRDRIVRELAVRGLWNEDDCVRPYKKTRPVERLQFGGCTCCENGLTLLRNRWLHLPLGGCLAAWVQHKVSELKINLRQFIFYSATFNFYADFWKIPFFFFEIRALQDRAKIYILKSKLISSFANEEIKTRSNWGNVRCRSVQNSSFRLCIKGQN